MKLWWLLGLGFFLAHTPTTQPMDRAAKIFHKACTIIGYGIQAMPVASGLYGLGGIAKAKYIDSPEIANKLQAEANFEDPEAVAFVRKTVQEIGLARFNDANHYEGLLIRRNTEPGGSWLIDASLGIQGQLMFPATAENLEKHGNQKAKDLARAAINHELKHKNDRDLEVTCCFMTALPFAIEFVTKKIKAPIKAFALAKNIISREPTCLKSIAKIAGAVAKTSVSFVAICALRQSIERKADRAIPDNIEQLRALSDDFEHDDHIQSLQKLTTLEKFLGDPLHPSFAERAKTAKDRANALIVKQQVNQA